MFVVLTVCQVLERSKCCLWSSHSMDPWRPDSSCSHSEQTIKTTSLNGNKILKCVYVLKYVDNHWDDKLWGIHLYTLPTHIFYQTVPCSHYSRVIYLLWEAIHSVQNTFLIYTENKYKCLLWIHSESLSWSLLCRFKYHLPAKLIFSK